MRLGPIGFLVAVTAAWAGVRSVMLWPERAPLSPSRPIAWQPPLPTRFGENRVSGEAKPPAPSARLESLPRQAGASVSRSPSHEPDAQIALISGPAEPVQPRPNLAPTFPPQSPITAVREPSANRLSVTTWAIVRGAGGSGLAAAGQLGGSQAGARARYELGSGVALAARVSGSLRTATGKEAAVALDWRPAPALPITLSLERRAGLDRGGRDALAFGLFGGVDSVRLPLGVRLDGYAQAGIVGAKRRDAYVDGAIRAERPLLAQSKLSLSAGAGLWGGAQPGVSRLDMGPQLSVRIPVASGAVRIGAEWRERVAGNARPGSGPALSVGADF